MFFSIILERSTPEQAPAFPAHADHPEDAPASLKDLLVLLGLRALSEGDEPTVEAITRIIRGGLSDD